MAPEIIILHLQHGDNANTKVHKFISAQRAHALKLAEDTSAKCLVIYDINDGDYNSYLCNWGSRSPRGIRICPAVKELCRPCNKSQVTDIWSDRGTPRKRQ